MIYIWWGKKYGLRIVGTQFCVFYGEESIISLSYEDFIRFIVFRVSVLVVEMFAAVRANMCSRDGQLIILLLACLPWAKMSLLITIFLLVFVTQLIAWIGKSVLLDIVCYYCNFFHDNLIILKKKRLMTCICVSLFHQWRCVNAR